MFISLSWLLTRLIVAYNQHETVYQASTCRSSCTLRRPAFPGTKARPPSPARLSLTSAFASRFSNGVNELKTSTSGYVPL